MPQQKTSFWSIANINEKLSNNLVWFAASMILVGAASSLGGWGVVSSWARDAAIQELHNNVTIQAQIKMDVETAVVEATQDDNISILIGAHLRKDDDFMNDLIVKLRANPQLLELIKGEPGSQGPAGRTGTQGITGPQGPQGVPGTQGISGPQGPQGVAGKDGEPGREGAAGRNGEDGVCLCPAEVESPAPN